MGYASTTELAVFGTVANIAVLFQSLFYGDKSRQPIVSASYGAGRRDRVAGCAGFFGDRGGMEVLVFAAAALGSC